MSTTLTNGLKLPDKGSVDWYADMQNNYQILDGAVGTVAEHTTALAGKAPAVHTHTKADITDLFNSANEWTDSQSYTQSIKFKVNLTIGAAPSSDLYGGFNFGNAGTNIGNITARVSSAGATYSRLYIGNKFTNGALDPNGTWKYTELQVGLRANGDKYLYTDGSWRNNLLPLANNTYDLGSSSYQWNNLYAKNYYYNGVAWGLDKANTWTTDQIIQNASINLKNTSISQGSSATTGGSAITLIDKNNQSLVSISPRVTSASRTIIELNVRNTYKNGALSNDQGAELIASSWYFGHLWNGTPYYTLTGCCDSDIIPKDNNSKNLGTSNLKWKTLNGVNPGALSLPDTYTNIDTTNWDLTGTLFSYTPPIDGWLFVNIRPDNNYAYVALEYANMRNNSESTTGKNAMVCIAVRAQTPVNITLSGASIAQARLAMCAGNV